MYCKKYACLTILFFLIITSNIILPGQSLCTDPISAFAVLADHKSRHKGLDMVLAFLESKNIEFIIVPGDFHPIAKAYNPYYEKYGFAVQSSARSDSHGLYLVLGNHDDPPKGDGFFRSSIAPYYPRNGPPDAPLGTVFSFDRGNAHLVVTNQYWENRKGGYNQDQLEWMSKDLAASSQQFNFVFGHEPAFPMANHIGNSLDSNPSVRDRFYKILADKKARIFFCGHSHHLSILQRDGVYQIDVGEVYNDHVSFATVHLYTDQAIVRLYETERFETNLPEALDIGTHEVFEIRLSATSAPWRDTLNSNEPIVFFDSPVDPPGGSSTNFCFIDTLIN